MTHAVHTLAGIVALGAALLARWLLGHAPDPAGDPCPGGRLWDTSRGQCPDLTRPHCVLTWRRTAWGTRLLVVAQRRATSGGTVTDADWAVPLTTRTHPYHARTLSS